MTILAVVKDVCAAIGVLVPQSLFSGLASSRTQQELLALANEMAQRIAYNHREWTTLKAMATLAGDGVLNTVSGLVEGTEGFDLPANYQRMLLRSNVWHSTRTQWPMLFVPNTEDWLKRRAGGGSDGSGEWTIYGGQIHIQPVMLVGQSAWFGYLDKNCVNLASGGTADHFTADGDSYRLDERLLKLGMIWQWKATKGGSYAEDLSTYGDALNAAAGFDQPAPIIVSGSLNADRWANGVF